MLVELPNTFGEAPTNMAVDAMLLDSLPEGIAVFRHYGWLEPSITFGYMQSYAEILNNDALGELRICRRMTGGGIVDHCNDWTYALVIQSDVPTAKNPANSLYESIHQAISQALDEQSVANRLAPCPRACGEAVIQTRAPESCFTKPVANDVLRPDGRKISGAAMKRTRKGLLVQGSIDRGALPESFDYGRFQRRLLGELSKVLNLPISQDQDASLLVNNIKLEEEKGRFASREWLQRR
ncbi:MAG: hypothetical protein AAF546_00895 [Verrucomicrobiota bacterium]